MSSLHFLDAPVIQQEQTNIKTVAGEEIHITCTVEAEPTPALTWHRDGQEVTDRDQGVVINQAGNRYNLIILGTQHYLLLISHSLTIFMIISELFLCSSMNVCVSTFI